MQLAASMATTDCPVLYVSGEESVQQLKMRADRLGMSTEHLFLVTETDLDVILGHINEIHPRLVVVDSIQTMYLDELTLGGGQHQPGARVCRADAKPLPSRPASR